MSNGVYLTVAEYYIQNNNYKNTVLALKKAAFYKNDIHKFTEFLGTLSAEVLVEVLLENCLDERVIDVVGQLFPKAGTTDYLLRYIQIPDLTASVILARLYFEELLKRG